MEGGNGVQEHEEMDAQFVGNAEVRPRFVFLNVEFCLQGKQVKKNCHLF